MSEIMVDLETLSTRSHAVILVIGAIKFNRGEKWNKDFTYNDLSKKNIFYKRINISSCIDIGLHTDPETEKWWNKQDKDVKYEALYNKNRIDIKQALEEFTKWFSDSTYIWGNGSSFDISILGEAYERCNLDIPWKFYNVRDLRTLYDLGNVDSRSLPSNDKHHAIYDCFRQIVGLYMAFDNII